MRPYYGITSICLIPAHMPPDISNWSSVSLSSASHSHFHSYSNCFFFQHLPVIFSRRFSPHETACRKDKYSKNTALRFTRRGTMAASLMATSGMHVTVATDRVSRCVGSGNRGSTRVRAGDREGDVDIVPKKAPVSGRRAALVSLGAGCLSLTPLRTPAADIGSVSLSSAAVNELLKPLPEYVNALAKADEELREIGKTLSIESGEMNGSGDAPQTDDPSYFDDPELNIAVPLTPKTRSTLKTKLHSAELGKFWVTSRGTDRYMAGARSSFAREKEDLWKLLPEKSGPLGGFLTPDFDNPDDPLCLVYSCVNDPRSPPSIDVLYALKLLDEGLATSGVTAVGLLGNVNDAIDKLSVYRVLVDAEADANLKDQGWRNPAPQKGWGRVGI